MRDLVKRQPWTAVAPATALDCYDGSFAAALQRALRPVSRANCQRQQVAVDCPVSRASGSEPKRASESELVRLVGMFHKINGTHQHAGCKSNGLPMLPIVFLGACLFATAAVCAAQQADAKMGQHEMDRARRSFATRCAPCHGLDGRGGEHAPSIVNSPAAQSRSNEALNQIIRSGIPDRSEE